MRFRLLSKEAVEAGDIFSIQKTEITIIREDTFDGCRIMQKKKFDFFSSE